MLNRKFLNQAFKRMPTILKTIEALSEDVYCRNVRTVVSIDPRRFSGKNGLHCRKSTLNGSIKIPVSPEVPNCGTSPCPLFKDSRLPRPLKSLQLSAEAKLAAALVFTSEIVYFNYF